MHDRSENPETAGTDDEFDSLKQLTPAQFMALGGNAVVYVRPIKGAVLATMMTEADDVDPTSEFQLVVSADGSPLMVGDTREAVADWLSERDYGVVSLH